jgi:putative addiction module component (TIGR02574 family)
MSALFDAIEKQARTLPASEKATLARILIEELDPSQDVEVEQLWTAESRRRYEAFRNDELEALPGDEVMARARRRLK